MKVLTMGILGIFLSATVTFAANCTERFSWQSNTASDIAGYKIRYGLTDGGPYINSVNIGKPTPSGGRIVAEVSSFTCDNYYYVVATAYDKSGVESDYSTQVGLLVTAPGDDPYPFIENIISK